VTHPFTSTRPAFEQPKYGGSSLPLREGHIKILLQFRGRRPDSVEIGRTVSQNRSRFMDRPIGWAFSLDDVRAQFRHGRWNCDSVSCLRAEFFIVSFAVFGSVLTLNTTRQSGNGSVWLSREASEAGDHSLRRKNGSLRLAMAAAHWQSPSSRSSVRWQCRLTITMLKRSEKLITSISRFGKKIPLSAPHPRPHHGDEAGPGIFQSMCFDLLTGNSNCAHNAIHQKFTSL
jgi:hypothetical protein